MRQQVRHEPASLRFKGQDTPAARDRAEHAAEQCWRRAPRRTAETGQRRSELRWNRHHGVAQKDGPISPADQAMVGRRHHGAGDEIASRPPDVKASRPAILSEHGRLPEASTPWREVERDHLVEDDARRPGEDAGAVDGVEFRRPAGRHHALPPGRRLPRGATRRDTELAPIANGGELEDVGTQAVLRARIEIGFLDQPGQIPGGEDVERVRVASPQTRRAVCQRLQREAAVGVRDRFAAGRLVPIVAVESWARERPLEPHEGHGHWASRIGVDDASGELTHGASGGRRRRSEEEHDTEPRAQSARDQRR